MLNIRVFILVLFTVAFADVYGQLHEDGAYVPDYDTNYIRDYRHRFSIALAADFKGVDFGLLQDGNPNIAYTSNLPFPMYGFVFSYRWLNFSVSVPLPVISQSDPNYTETDGYSLALALTRRKWYFRNFYENYVGFQLSNPQAVDPNYFVENTLNPDYANLRQRTYFATLYYGFNGEKYSHRNLMWQSETQLKSAGSFLIGVSGGYKWIDSDKDITPTHFETDSIDDSDILNIQYLNAGLSFGYSHTFVLPYNLNFSLMLAPALSFIDGYTTTRDYQTKDFRSKVGINAESRVLLSYNSKNFYSGVSYTIYGFSNGFQDEFSLGTIHGLIRLTFGYHFHMKPIKALKKLDLSN